ncbi:hypothetical protein [Butyrivibrio sp. YAB3001]|uniref:hypothetical protein n=1 Tax=Butyrivibrio sp. YAB3001 TaxID=1520812 RepID=UPI0008F656C2|nr:hypothetical protein [Butyrivibrio sp. YAB3001]SFC34609.1 hypothetical protein SAMN02910398_02047 [Butyrivibrio sp. YAB3001]
MEMVTKGEQKEKETANQNGIGVGIGYSATESAFQSTQQAAVTYAKPETYTGNRTIYDDGQAKLLAKNKMFSGGTDVYDPYTGDRLCLTKKEAKALYGDQWTKHLAESDHVRPLEKIFEETRHNVWNTTDDIRDAANSDDNLRVVSRRFNNAKRSRTNDVYVKDEDYLEKKGVKLTEGGKEQAIRDDKQAQQSIKAQLKKSKVSNIIKTGHEAGIAGAEQAGITTLTISGIMNIVAVIKGEKTKEEALGDTAKAVGVAAGTGYVMGGGLTVVSHTLSDSSSELIRSLANSNIPGKVITAVVVTGNTLRRYGTGEISTEECLIELGDKGLNMFTMGYSMAVGQTLIPIPIVGGAIGALVGSMLTSSYYKNLINQLKSRELANEERERIISECHKAAEQTRQYRIELEAYLQRYFAENRQCFDDALSSMQFAFDVGDSDAVIAAANEITEKLGGSVKYRTVSEFKNFLDSDTVDVF